MKYKTVIAENFKDYPPNSCIGDDVWLNCGLYKNIRINTFVYSYIYHVDVVTYVEKDNVNQTIPYDSLACKN